MNGEQIIHLKYTHTQANTHSHTHIYHTDAYTQTHPEHIYTLGVNEFTRHCIPTYTADTKKTGIDSKRSAWPLLCHSRLRYVVLCVVPFPVTRTHARTQGASPNRTTVFRKNCTHYTHTHARERARAFTRASWMGWILLIKTTKIK